MIFRHKINYYYLSLDGEDLEGYSIHVDDNTIFYSFHTQDVNTHVVLFINRFDYSDRFLLHFAHSTKHLEYNCIYSFVRPQIIRAVCKLSYDLCARIKEY